MDKVNGRRSNQVLSSSLGSLTRSPFSEVVPNRGRGDDCDGPQSRLSTNRLGEEVMTSTTVELYPDPYKRERTHLSYSL